MRRSLFRPPRMLRPLRRVLPLPVTPGWELLKAAFWQWSGDDPFQLAAALAFYAFFSLAPLLVIAIAIAGLAFGHDAAQNHIIAVLQGLLGRESAVAIQDLVQRANAPQSGRLAAMASVVTLLVGAGGVVGQLKASLNRIWGVTPKAWGGMLPFLQERFVSWALVLGLGFLLLVSLLISTVLTAVLHWMQGVLPGVALFWHLVDVLVSLSFTTVLFAVMYRVLPDVRLGWPEVRLGAAVTALLFTLGKALIGWYLGYRSVASVYGAAGSLVVVLLWVYYSALIFFFGAQFTQVYTRTYGRGVVPTRLARVATEEVAVLQAGAAGDRSRPLSVERKSKE